MAIVPRHLTLTAIGWIDASALPPSPLRPRNWFDKTLAGLHATANHPPPAVIEDVQAFRDGHDFRALLHADLMLQIDSQSKKLVRCELASHVLDPGWTPPFKATGLSGWVLRTAPQAVLTHTVMSEEELERIRDPKAYAGELAVASSYVSAGADPAMVQRQSELAPPRGERLLMQGLIKFRAGAHTDDTGYRVIECPHHVPWTWCEVQLSLAGDADLRLRARMAAFPSFSFYLGGAVQPHGHVGSVTLRGDRIEQVVRAGAMGRIQPNEPVNASRLAPVSAHPQTIGIVQAFDAPARLLL